ncbi:reverse transcriptase domain-containing protein [Tanacetum coccineum]
MAEEDEDNTAFFAGEGVCYYRKMPFGLKNVGATYQRLVDKVFNDQIGRNLEAYIDDMVIKITSEEGPFPSSKCSKVVQTKKHTVDTRSRNNTPGNEETYGNFGNAHSANTWRSSNNVSHSFDRKRKCCFIREKGKWTSSYLLQYEALLAGLRISQELEIVNLAIFIDSQLLVNQVKGIYTVKQPAIKEYLQRTKETLRGVMSYTIEHVLRVENKEKQEFLGSFRSRVIIIQDQDKVGKILRACHWKEHEIMSLTVPSPLIRLARHHLYGLDRPILIKGQD